MSASEAALLKVFSSLASVDTSIPEGLLSPPPDGQSDGQQSQESDLESLKLEPEGEDGGDLQQKRKRAKMYDLDLHRFQVIEREMTSVHQNVSNLRSMIVKRNLEIEALRKQCQGVEQQMSMLHTEFLRFRQSSFSATDQ